MNHWIRKYMGDVASTAAYCAATYALTQEQRELIEQARTLAHRLSTGTEACTQHSACVPVGLLCAACLKGFPGEPLPECGGRRDWRIPCHLMSRC